ncbi:MAG: MCP four helix bundle domain-containing protein [Bacteroidota bacterium]|jgi:uncharacterized protein (UPF0333 family)
MEEPKSKPLLYILILLILLLISVGLINYYYVKKIDDSYSELIESLLKEDKAIHEVTRNSTKSIFILSKILKAKTLEEKRNLYNELEIFTQKNNKNFKILDSICNDDFRKKNLTQLVDFRKGYLSSKDSLLKLVELFGVTENVKSYYRNVVKTKLDVYQDQQMLFAYNAKYAILENSDAITKMSSKIRNITFGLLFLPIVIIGVGILYVFTILYRTSSFEDDI